ncbi:MAG: hypothetical protein EPO07_05910 [Verrucomicrobia bacterium]|nr:MAG: hypothetical protein EPO07_05910 [Verrucomicrobiota bacterium]
MTLRAETIRFRGKVESRDGAALLLSNPGDAVIVERGKPRLLILRCPCGCGDDLLINLDRRAGAAWYLYQKRKGITLFPSYWRDDKCGSHFILWNDHIYWCLGWETDESDTWQVSLEIEDKVYAAMPDEWFVNYEQLAEQLDFIPWEVLQACRQLVKKGKAAADKWPRGGTFRRAASV